MDAEQGLEMHRKYGEGERGVTGNLQYTPSTIQTTETFVLDKFPAQKEESPKNKDAVHIYGSSGLSISSSRLNSSLDDYTGAYPQIPKVSNDGKRILEIEPAKGNQRHIRSITHGPRGMGQGKLDQYPKDERSISLSTGSERENNSNISGMGVRELRGDESVDLSTTVETRTTNQIQNNIDTDKRINATMLKLPELSEMIEQLNDDPRGYHENTDEKLLHPEDREYFHEVFGITGVHPVFVDHSGMVVWMLDDRGIMFKWNEMEQGMQYMGRNLKEGLANYLYYPENICVIIESTGELIPVMEFKACVEKQGLAEPVKVIKVGKKAKRRKKGKKNK